MPSLFSAEFSTAAIELKLLAPAQKLGTNVILGCKVEFADASPLWVVSHWYLFLTRVAKQKLGVLIRREIVRHPVPLILHPKCGSAGRYWS